ncbi:MAG: hypothetical protein ACMUIE_00360 [Thermoplasmatota archaeon]
MASTNFFDKLDIVKVVIITVVLINATLWGLVAIYFLTDKEGSALEESSPWQDAKATPEGVPKSDSDIRMINEEPIAWPDKLSDIEENYIYGTDWRQPDTDHDGMEDGWEALYSRPNPITERLTIDPNDNDWSGNPDGDGFDFNNNGVIDKEEELFNLREYVGGVEFNWTTLTFEKGDPMFGELSPTADWQEIGRKGGFHLYDDPTDGLVGDPTNIDNDNLDDYMRYNPYLPQEYKPVTTNPSLWDTDLDGMDDGWEIHYGRELKSLFFDGETTTVYEGSINQYLEATVVGEKSILQLTQALAVPWTQDMIDPLNPNDADYDLDIRYGFSLAGGVKTPIKIYTKDDLTNKEEYENHTSPLLWDTDADSHFNALAGELYILNDFVELSVNYTESAVDWNKDGLLDYRTCPYMADSDGDGMWDGWELETGLKPLNSTDRFKDLDNDGLPNYLENAFPNKENLWFQTDPKNPDTDGDGMLDGWEAYNAKIISQTPAFNTREDLEDKIADSKRTVFTVTPMIYDADEDNDGWWNVTEAGDIVFTKIPDGMTNLEEFLGTTDYPVSTNPNDPDTDGDGLTDGEELKMGFYGELVGDNYFNDPLFAAKYYTNATMADSDADFGGSLDIGQVGNTSRHLDDWEETNGRTKEMLPANGFDDDGDGEIDEGEDGEEYLTFSPTNATNPDTDLDGWMDVDELYGIDTSLLWERSKLGIVRTDPNKKDTDNDQMSDYDELHRIPNYREWITDPQDPDTDNDGMEDGLENKVDFFPLIDWNKNDNYDANGDGDYSDEELGDVWSTDDRVNPTKMDTDGDGLPDGWEYRFGKVIKSDETRKMIQEYDRIYRTNYWNDLIYGGHFWIVNPLVSSDPLDDFDHDDLTNVQEWENGTHPLKWDTDGDGMPDGWELQDENRGSPLYNPEKRKYAWILDPLNGNDWCLDADHDGFVFGIWTPATGDSYELVDYYFPWINLYEYRYGYDPDHDGINEITTSPAPRDLEYNIIGGYDTDSDGMPDGWEVWVTDYIGNISDPQPFEDNDSLPKGWEELFNGSMWDKPECYIYEEMNGTWDPWANSKTIGRRTYVPTGIATNKDYFKGRMFADRKDADMDGVLDPEENDDSDGHNNFQEYRGHTDPTDKNAEPGKYNIPRLQTGPSRKMVVGEEPSSRQLTLPADMPEIEDTLQWINTALATVGIEKLSREEIRLVHFVKPEEI